MTKKVLALLCAAVFLLSTASSALATRPAPEVIEGERYVSDHLEGASALYVSGEAITLDNAYFYGAGYATDAEITAQIPNQYGLCATVLAAGQGTEVTLNNPTIVSDPESYANGVFAAAMAKITVNGGTIDTDNSSGHGVDATYMGRVYINDTVIHTRGETSGALATDFGGGFIVGKGLECMTESGSSPGIFCAGSTVILLKDSTLTTATATGIVVAHDHAVVVLNNCEVNAAGTAVSGLQALPNAASSDGSTFYAFGGKLLSRSGAVVGESGGRTAVNLIGPECTAGGDTAISCKSAGILTVNLWDTELTGNIDCAEGCSITVNVYAGGKLNGEVTGEGTVEIHVYEGGEYTGGFAAVQEGAGEDMPILGGFDDYLISCWASGSSTWTESRARDYVTNIEPKIIENSAAALTANDTAAVAYDPAVYNPSENGVDLSLLNVGGAHGFTVDEIFGGQSGGMPSGMPSGGSKPEGKPDTAGQAAKKPSGKSDSSSVIDTILNVGTTQAFVDEAVPVEDLKTILQAGLSAASAINQQPWYFVAVTNQEVMNEIAGASGVSSDANAAAPAAVSNDFGASDGGSFAPSEGGGGDFAPSEGGGDFAPSDGNSFGPSDGGSAMPASSGTAKAGLGDSPAAIIIYRNDATSSPNADFDCGLATQNMVIAAAALGYGVKIVSSPTMTLNGADHDTICEKLGVDKSLQAVAVLLIGPADTDAVTSATTRETLETRATIIE